VEIGLARRVRQFGSSNLSVTLIFLAFGSRVVAGSLVVSKPRIQRCSQVSSWCPP
jgi:hypothetical protein